MGAELPISVAILVGSRPSIMGRVLGIVYRCIATHLIKKSGYPQPHWLFLHDGPHRRGDVDPALRQGAESEHPFDVHGRTNAAGAGCAGAAKWVVPSRYGVFSSYRILPLFVSDNRFSDMAGRVM